MRDFDRMFLNLNDLETVRYPGYPGYQLIATLDLLGSEYYASIVLGRFVSDYGRILGIHQNKPPEEIFSQGFHYFHFKILFTYIVAS